MRADKRAASNTAAPSSSNRSEAAAAVVPRLAQPACDVYRGWWTFDARSLLERLRNKRLMFVGDSLNRNQWESMVCLVQSAIPSREHKTLAKFVGANVSLNVFTAHQYNATVEFYWAPFLVQSNSDDPQLVSESERMRMKKLEELNKTVDSLY